MIFGTLRQQSKTGFTYLVKSFKYTGFLFWTGLRNSVGIMRQLGMPYASHTAKSCKGSILLSLMQNGA